MTLLKHTPKFSLQEAEQLAKELYNIQAEAKPLPSERDQNFLLITHTADAFVLKIANATEDRALLDAQNQAMLHLVQSVPICPQVLPATTGHFISEALSSTGTLHLVRLVTYLPGIPLGAQRRHSPALRTDLGRRIGQVDRALSAFDHPAVHRDFHWDFSNALAVIDQHKGLVTDPGLRSLVDKFSSNFKQNVVPRFDKLRRSIIHNDPNDYNVIVGGGDDLYSRNQAVIGLIDFGDMLYSYTVSDLAIAIAYAILDKPDPLAVAAQVVKGYQAVYPLTNAEISALFGLICMRLCMSVCMAAYQQQQRPDDQYLAISQQPIRNTLPKLAGVHPRLAEAIFRQACGLPPVPAAESVRRWLEKPGHKFAPLLGLELSEENSTVFDLSVGSPLIHGDGRQNEAEPFSARLSNYLQQSGAKIGLGRYDEARLIYTDPAFASGDKPTDERRTIHLGLDLFAEAGAAVYAPLPGTVHAIAHNTAPLDYGGVLVLEHQTDAGQLFYTLYGHLNFSSIESLSIGQSIAQAEQVALLGTPAQNGGWPPHLHFQIVTDLLDLDCDFPGVAPASQREVWRQLSPDPNLIVGLPAACFPAVEPSKAETLTARRQLTGRNLSIGYREHLKIVRGWMQYLYDETGRRYLDAYNNVPHVGHCHPRIVQAAQAQIGVLNTNTRYLHDNLNRYAERLTETMPDPLNVCFILNSASEANELAIRLARAHTGQRDMIVLDGAYHGHTNTLIDISPYKHDGPGGRGAPSWVHTAPLADVYRGPYKASDPQAGEKYARHILEIAERLRERGTALAGFIAESCPSVGGQIFFPEGYLAAAYQHIRQAGGLCIADEVQTGYGRTGTHFYAFEGQEVIPDIVVLGKPIGNGHPVAALVTTAEIADSFNNGMEFFSTFGGNTVSCAVGLAVLETVLDENLQEHAWQVGNHLLAGLRPLKDRFAIVGDVRGSGLFLGIELVRDRETLEPAPEEASFIANRMRDQGILLGTDGPYHNVVKIRPPMPFSKQDADLLIKALEEILAEDFEQ